MTETQTTPAPVPVPPKSGRGLRIALAVSVALNLAVMGVVAGALLRDGRGGPPGITRDFGFGPFTEALSPEDRRALRKSLIDRAPDLRQARRQSREDVVAILAALRADPFDPDRLSVLMDGQHTRMAGQLKLGEEMIRDFLLDLSPERRLAFADRLEAKLKDRGPDRKDGPGRGIGGEDADHGMPPEPPEAP